MMTGDPMDPPLVYSLPDRPTYECYGKTKNGLRQSGLPAIPMQTNEKRPHPKARPV
jgi:hypothetical protein